MPRSLRRSVIGWYALLACVAFAGFGVLLNLRVRSALFGRAEASIEGHARAIAATVEFDLLSGWEVGLGEGYLQGIASEGWYEVLDPKGRMLLRGGTLPGALTSEATGLLREADVREFVLGGPGQIRVRVGRSVAREVREARELFLLTLGSGVALLLLLLLGGWWITTRTLQPIRTMSATAGRISASDLASRVDAEAVPQELRDLALTLNDTFDRLERAFQGQVRFTGDVSHELRTPLAVIRTQVEQALRRERSGPEYRQALHACLRSVDRMTRLVEQMLAFARLERSGAPPAANGVALDEIARDSVEEVLETAATAGVTVHVRAAPACVLGDALRLRAVTSNLLSNAVRYNRPGGRVDVLVEREGTQVVLSVADDGIGIEPEALPHIFERFYQVDAARTSAGGGAGLGLALVQRIVLDHGGTVVAESRPGEGSVFTVRLPALPNAAPDPGANHGSPDRPPASAGPAGPPRA